MKWKELYVASAPRACCVRYNATPCHAGEIFFYVLHAARTVRREMLRQQKFYQTQGGSNGVLFLAISFGSVAAGVALAKMLAQLL